MVDKATKIECLLTLEKDSKILIKSRPALLIIDDPNEKDWTHNWHIKDVQLPMPLEEVNAMLDKGMEDQKAWFKIFLAERERMRSFEGEAFITSLAYTGVLVTLQGATVLTVSS